MFWGKWEFLESREERRGASLLLAPFLACLEHLLWICVLLARSEPSFFGCFGLLVEPECFGHGSAGGHKSPTTPFMGVSKRGQHLGTACKGG